ncbi:MAG: cytochrome c, partial [Chloroflexota bacterium]
IFTPWLSRGGERRPFHRPLGMATLAVVMVAATGLTSRAYLTTPPSQVEERGIVLTSQQLRGRQVVLQQGCRSCHIIAGETGWQEGKGDAQRVRGPSLDGIGGRMTLADIHTFMEKPKTFNPDATMQPLIPPLSHEDVEAITQYLLTLDQAVPQ